MVHYASCKEGGGSYIGAYFNAVSDTAAGYASRGLNGVEWMFLTSLLGSE